MLKIWYIDKLGEISQTSFIESLADEVPQIAFVCFPVIEKKTNSELVLIARGYTDKCLPEILSTNAYRVYEAVLEENLEYGILIEVLLLQLLMTQTMEDDICNLIETLRDNADLVQVDFDEITVESLDDINNVLSEIEDRIEEGIHALDVGSYDTEALIEDIAYSFVEIGLCVLQSMADSDYDGTQSLYESFVSEVKMCLSDVIYGICQIMIQNKKLYLKSVNYEFEATE